MPLSCPMPAGELCHFHYSRSMQAVGRVAIPAGEQMLLSWSKTPGVLGRTLLVQSPQGCLGLCFPLPPSPASVHLPVRLTQRVVRVMSTPPLVSVGVRFVRSQELALAIKL